MQLQFILWVDERHTVVVSTNTTDSGQGSVLLLHFFANYINTQRWLRQTVSGSSPSTWASTPRFYSTVTATQPPASTGHLKPLKQMTDAAVFAGEGSLPVRVTPFEVEPIEQSCYYATALKLRRKRHVPDPKIYAFFFALVMLLLVRLQSYIVRACFQISVTDIFNHLCALHATLPQG